MSYADYMFGNQSMFNPNTSFGIDDILKRYLQSYGNTNSGLTNPAAVNAIDNLQAQQSLPPEAVQQTAQPVVNPTVTTAAPATSAAPDISTMRSNFAKQAAQKFGNNYGQKLIGDNVLDTTINDILSEQRGGAQTYLDRGKARGIYNDVGYNAGQKAIASGEQAGTSNLRSLASGVIDKYRSQADSVRDKAYNAANNYNDGMDFNLDEYSAQGDKVASNAGNFGGGDLRNIFGGTNLFDLSKITGSIGSAQGATNLKDADVATALTERKRRDGMQRGIGSQGVF